MLEYRRIGGTDDKPEYEYLIEGKPGKAGRISFDVSIQDGVMLDHENEVQYQRYASKLIGHLDWLVENRKDLMESGTYMWY